MKQICDWEKIQEDSQCLTKHGKCKFDKRKKKWRRVKNNTKIIQWYDELWNTWKYTDSWLKI